MPLPNTPAGAAAAGYDPLPVPTCVDRDAAVPAGQDGPHGLLVEPRISGQHEHLVQVSHGPV